MTLSQSTDAEFVRAMTELIYENLENEKFGVKELSRIAGMSKASLNQRLKTAVRKRTNEFIRELRLRRALELLQNGTYTASEISYRVGFSSPAYFNKCFHVFFGYPPGKVKKVDSTGPAVPVPAEERPVIPEKGIYRHLPWIKTGWMVLIACAAGIFLFLLVKSVLFLNQGDKLPVEDGKITLAVLPFRNITNDTLWNIWEEGVQSNLITSLSNTEELVVRQAETVNGLLHSRGITNYAFLTPSFMQTVSRKLDAGIFISGSLSRAGHVIRLNTQLIHAVNNRVIRSFRIDGAPDKILEMLDSISYQIRNTLRISGMDKPEMAGALDRFMPSFPSPEAYQFYLYGNLAFYGNDFPTAIERFQKTLALDSNFVLALAKIALAYYNQGLYEEGKVWCARFYGKLDNMNLYQRTEAHAIYSLFFKTLNDRIQYLRQLTGIDNQNPMTWFNIGDCYFEMQQWNKAIPEFEKALAIFHKWGTKPYWGAFYYELGICYHKSKQFRKEKKLYRKAEKDFPGDPGLMDQQAWLALVLGDTAKAGRYLRKWTAIRKEESWSDARIAGYMAYIYSMAENPSKEEEWYRKALSLEPEKTGRLNSLAYFLINSERNVPEGMQLVSRALEINPESYNSMMIKGWGLYRQKQYREALDLLQKSWDLRMRKSIYKHRAFLHLEEAKKAVAAL